MKVSVSEAKGQLTELMRRAETGEDVVFTRHGHAEVRLVPVRPIMDKAGRRGLLEAARRAGAAKATRGARAPRGHDFLYGEDGLPE